VRVRVAAQIPLALDKVLAVLRVLGRIKLFLNILLLVLSWFRLSLGLLLLVLRFLLGLVRSQLLSLFQLAKNGRVFKTKTYFLLTISPVTSSSRSFGSA
jgi:hypothetical protein